MLNRYEKQDLVGQLKARFEKSDAAFVVVTQGLTVSQISSLRGAVRRQGGFVEVAKNTLLSLATRDLQDMQQLEQYFKHQIAVVFADAQATEIAKILNSFAKQHEKLRIVGGVCQARLLDARGVQYLATLPPLPVLQAQLCGTLNAPMVGVVSVLNQVLTRLVWVLKAASEK